MIFILSCTNQKANTHQRLDVQLFQDKYEEQVQTPSRLVSRIVRYYESQISSLQSINFSLAAAKAAATAAAEKATEGDEADRSVEKALKESLREHKAALRGAKSKNEEYEDEVQELKAKLATFQAHLQQQARETENAKKSAAVVINELKKRKAEDELERGREDKRGHTSAPNALGSGKEARRASAAMPGTPGEGKGLTDRSKPQAERLQRLKKSVHTVGAAFHLLLAEKLYDRGGEFRPAVNAAEKALEYSTALGNRHFMALAWAWRGVGYHRVGQAKSAIDSFDEARVVVGGLERDKNVEVLERTVKIWQKDMETYERRYS